MDELLSNPAVQAGVAPFVAGLVVALALQPLRLGGLAAAAAFLVAMQLVKRLQCGGNATGSFKRSEFGMKFGLPTAVGDEVKLWMSFYGFKQ